jgi:hypothetical protein
MNQCIWYEQEFLSCGNYNGASEAERIISVQCVPLYVWFEPNT